MNNYLALFSGTIKNVEVSKRNTEFGLKTHQTVVLECEENRGENELKIFYLRSGGDKIYEVGSKVHLLATIEYRKVKSKKAFIEVGGKKVEFEYGAFDFTITKQLNDKELVKGHKEQIENYE